MSADGHGLTEGRGGLARSRARFVAGKRFGIASMTFGQVDACQVEVAYPFEPRGRTLPPAQDFTASLGLWYESADHVDYRKRAYSSL
jgi:hypothetical protein